MIAVLPSSAEQCGKKLASCFMCYVLIDDGQWLDMIAPLYSYRWQQQQSRKVHRKATYKQNQRFLFVHIWYLRR